MNFAWMGAEEELTAAALTVRAQLIPLDDNGTLLWPNFFPRQDVDSLAFRNIGTTDFRPVADRREFNQRGRLIPVRTPGTSQIKWVPIESYFSIGEEEINELLSQVRGNEGLFRDAIRVQIPPRTDDLVTANSRRIEVDAFSAWGLNQITQRNAQLGTSQTIPLGLDATRYVTAATAWNNVAVNAFDEAVAFMLAAIAKMGPVRGMVSRLNVVQEIVRDAPAGANGLALVRTQVETLIGEQIGMPFRFYVIENTVELFGDGGTDTTSTKVWPAQRVAALPASGRIGNTFFGPVARAYNLTNLVPKAGIDLRGMTVYHEVENGGRGLIVECQVNAFSFPDERFVYVINVGF